VHGGALRPARRRAVYDRRVAHRDEIAAFADGLLEVDRWQEFGPAGLQVVGVPEVEHLACGVSSSLELFQRAAEAGAQLVLVHHGLFWRNEPLVVDRRLRGRLEALFHADMSLLAYHLALDAHPEVGNNAQLARRIGVEPNSPFGDVGLGGSTAAPVGIDELAGRVAAVVEREPLVFTEGPAAIERVAVSTGAAGHDLVRAAHEGYHCLVTGEPEEPSLHTARELGIHLVAAGHHASERLGVQALAHRIAERFGVSWEFVEVDNPV
jgi:dinuclear metal center YbgI/SA1388 family protein